MSACVNIRATCSGCGAEFDGEAYFEWHIRPVMRAYREFHRHHKGHAGYATSEPTS